MKSSIAVAGTAGLAQQYNDLRTDAYGGSMLLPHEQASPGLTLKIEPGVFYMKNGQRVIYAGGNTPSFSAPASNPRIDLVTIDATGTVAITQGAEAGSPVAPTYPTDKQAICEVYNRVGESSIKTANDSVNGYVLNDVRQFLTSNFPDGYFVCNFQKNLADANTVQTVAHGLGVAPRVVEGVALHTLCSSFGAFDSTTNNFINTLAGPAVNYGSGVFFELVPVAGNIVDCVVSVDATNITLTWTKTSSPTGNAVILLKAWA